MKNWKTTLAGLGLALPNLLVGAGFIESTNKWIALTNGITAILFGLSAKDSDVTGGTRVQPDK